MNIHIRAFTENDTQNVIALWVECDLVRPWNDPEKDIQRKMQVGQSLFLVAELNQKIVGSAMGGYEGHRGWINYLAVEQQHRLSGVGAQLVQAIEQQLLALGCPKINLLVRGDNLQAIAFYEKLGFAQDQAVCLGKRLIPDNEQ